MELLPSEPSELVREDNHFKQLGLSIVDYQGADAVVDLLWSTPS